MNQDKERVVRAAKKWRETELKVIANKSGDNQREHFKEKMNLREAVDKLNKGGQP